MTYDNEVHRLIRDVLGKAHLDLPPADNGSILSAYDNLAVDIMANINKAGFRWVREGDDAQGS